MTGDSNDALDDNTFPSGVKVILHPNIYSTVGIVKEIGMKVDDKAEIKKNKWETDYPQRAMRQGLLPAYLSCTPFTIVLCSLPQLPASTHDQRST
jgi:hypothetical protein